MSWLGDRFKQLGNVRLDSHTIGNVLKNVSPAASFIPGLGIPVTAALAAGGEALRGKTKLSDLLKAAGSNAAIGGGARGLYNAAQSAAGNLGGGGASAVTPSGPSSWEDAAVRSHPGMPSAIGAAPSVAPQVGARSTLSQLLSGAGSAASSVGQFADKHAGGLQVAGNVAGGILGARAQDAQTGLQQQQFDLQKQQVDAQEQRRQKLAALLAPLLQPQYRG